MYNPIKIKVEAFSFDLRSVSSFMTKSKPYMKFSNAPNNYFEFEPLVKEMSFKDISHLELWWSSVRWSGTVLFS